mmetsp:Transcript_244/g.547  ORF Transcript_244/g.547 Transcript_244/m.547 type:complete len:289 (-) Transcript_244:119-985(-)
MGASGSAAALPFPMQCCHEEDLDVGDLDLSRDAPVIAALHTLTNQPASSCGPGRDGDGSGLETGQRWGGACCSSSSPARGSQAHHEAVGSGGLADASPLQRLESLSYTPVRFDESSTIDIERSQQRYSKIVVHCTRARTQRRSKSWEDWLRAATHGRDITLLQLPSEGTADDNAAAVAPIEKIAARYSLDRSLSNLSVKTERLPAITIPLDAIQVICAASDFVLFFDQVKGSLDESERKRAVLLQYATEASERKRACFLEESEAEKERFVHAFTALWLEKRDDHSMWF